MLLLITSVMHCFVIIPKLKIINLFERILKDYLDEIQYWIKHIDDESERRDIQIINLKMDLEKVDFDLLEAKKTYEFRTAAIEDWLAYKKKKEEKEAQEAREQHAALKIQVSENFIWYL